MRSHVLALRLLQTFWGVAAIAGLFLYSLNNAMSASPATESEEPLSEARGVRPFASGRAALSPREREERILSVHFACAADDAHVVRFYDSPPSGRIIVLRLDQSAEQMRDIYLGIDPRFPTDTRIIATPCVQDMIDLEAFP